MQKSIDEIKATGMSEEKALELLSDDQGTTLIKNNLYDRSKTSNHKEHTSAQRN